MFYSKLVSFLFNQNKNENSRMIDIFSWFLILAFFTANIALIFSDYIILGPYGGDPARMAHQTYLYSTDFSYFFKRILTVPSPAGMHFVAVCLNKFFNITGINITHSKVILLLSSFVSCLFLTLSWYLVKFLANSYYALLTILLIGFFDEHFASISMHPYHAPYAASIICVALIVFFKFFIPSNYENKYAISIGILISIATFFRHELFIICFALSAYTFIHIRKIKTALIILSSGFFYFLFLYIVKFFFNGRSYIGLNNSENLGATHHYLNNLVSGLETIVHWLGWMHIFFLFYILYSCLRKNGSKFLPFAYILSFFLALLLGIRVFDKLHFIARHFYVIKHILTISFIIVIYDRISLNNFVYKLTTLVLSFYMLSFGFKRYVAVAKHIHIWGDKTTETYNYMRKTVEKGDQIQFLFDFGRRDIMKNRLAPYVYPENFRYTPDHQRIFSNIPKYWLVPGKELEKFIGKKATSPRLSYLKSRGFGKIRDHLYHCDKDLVCFTSPLINNKKIVLKELSSNPYYVILANITDSVNTNDIKLKGNYLKVY